MIVKVEKFFVGVPGTVEPDLKVDLAHEPFTLVSQVNLSGLGGHQRLDPAEPAERSERGRGVGISAASTSASLKPS